MMGRPFTPNAIVDCARNHAQRWCCCLSLLVAVASPTYGRALPPHGTSRPTLASDPSGHNHICFGALYYGPLPGRANYCLGLRSWNAGHYRDGLEFLKLAAGWGNKNAQYTLGLIYYNGHHVVMDPALGIAWLKLANERGNDPQITLAMKSAIKWATPTQQHHAQQLFEEMRPTYGDRVAAERALHHLHHWQESHNKRDAGLVCLYGAQLHAAMMAGLTGMAPAIARAIETASGGTYKPVCLGINLPVQQRMIKKSAEQYFEGWAGVVTVGPLKTVPAPAASTHH